MKKTFRKIERRLNLWVYFKVLKYLPVYYNRGGNIGKILKAKPAKKFFTYVGNDVNIERNAMITSNMRISDRLNHSI